jgi:hypothetical protein
MPHDPCWLCCRSRPQDRRWTSARRSLGASWWKSSAPNPGRQCKVRRSTQRGYRAHDFQNLLIEVTRQHESAFTLFGRLRVDGSNRLDLK